MGVHIWDVPLSTFSPTFLLVRLLLILAAEATSRQFITLTFS